MTEKNDFTIDNPIMYDKENGRCRCIPIPYEKYMAEKRFENRLDKSNVKFNTLNPVWDNEKEDALNVFEMIDELNRLNLDCSNLIDDNTEYVVEINQMHKENEQLKQQVQNIHKLINSKIQSARELGNLRTVIALKNLQRELKGDGND